MMWGPTPAGPIRRARKPRNPGGAPAGGVWVRTRAPARRMSVQIHLDHLTGSDS